MVNVVQLEKDVANLKAAIEALDKSDLDKGDAVAAMGDFATRLDAVELAVKALDKHVTALEKAVSKAAKKGKSEE